VHLTYVSGDAQEVALSDVGNLLPLEVRAWSACGPIEGATVEFKLLENGDSIDSPATTDGSGLAQSRWVLDQNNQRQRAVATLVDLGPNAGDHAQIHQPTSSVEFIANLDLGGGEPDQQVITIRRVLRGDTKPLVNDDEFAVLQLLPASAVGNLPGIVITTDRPVDPRTVVGKKTLNNSETNNSSPTCFVSIDLPWPAAPQDRAFWGSPHFPLGFENIVLAAEVRVDGNQILWTPATETRQFLLSLVQNRLKGMADRVLAHLTLKGYFICDKLDAGAEATFLDGEPFGPRPSVGFQPRSGDKRPGGDFEMWFWLVAG